MCLLLRCWVDEGRQLRLQLRQGGHQVGVAGAHLSVHVQDGAQGDGRELGQPLDDGVSEPVGNEAGSRFSNMNHDVDREMTRPVA